MHYIKLLFLSFFSFVFINSFSQRIELVNKSFKTHIRGLSVVDNKVAWVSGSQGMIGKSIDGGNTWEWNVIPGYEDKDFRDIEAFDKETAVIMGIASPAIILKTTDGGKTWKEVYHNAGKEMFMDAMHFWNVNSGIVIGDPIDGKFFIIRTFDGGNTWIEIPEENLPTAHEGEACFAASGTNIRGLDRDEACFVTGGKISRFFWRNKPVVLPLNQGKESTGANSIAVRDPGKLKRSLHLVVVGGDFSNDTLRQGNCAVSSDGGKSWNTPATLPFGYRSCVEYLTKNQLVTCGTSGVDHSMDGGMNWINISKEGFHTVRKAKKGNLVLLAGSNGRIARYVY